MEPSLTLFTILTCMTLLVLIAGIIIMAKGGKTSKKYSNKLMIARVALQLFAIIIFGGLYFFAK